MKYTEILQRVLDSHLFDYKRYSKTIRKRFENSKALKISMIENYLHAPDRGWISPSSVVNCLYYYEKYPDVRSAGMPAFLHFAIYGIIEGRIPSKNVEDEVRFIESLEIADFDYYVKQHRADNIDLNERNFIVHYVCIGEKQGLFLSDVARRLMDGKKTNTRASTKIRAICEKLRPVSEEAMIDTIRASHLFDEAWYLAQNPDVAAANIDPIFHYVSNGEREERRPCPQFHPTTYLSLNPDVRQSGIPPFFHFVTHGFKEGRPGDCSPPLNRNSARSALFVCHDGHRAGAQVALLEIVRWFNSHTDRRVKVLFLRGGSIVSDFASVAEIYVCAGREDFKRSDFREFIEKDFDFVYLNTVVSGKILLNPCAVNWRNVVCHIHELKGELSKHKAELALIKDRGVIWLSASPATTECLKNTFGIDNDIQTIDAFITRQVSSIFDVGQQRRDARRRLEISNDAFVVTGCGTADLRKGVDIFIDTAISILQLGVVKHLYFVWIGDGPLLRRCMERVATAGLSDRILMPGAFRDGAALIACGDVFFLSSREDPYPLVCLEAAQYAIPSVYFLEAGGIGSFLKSDAGTALTETHVSAAVEALVELIGDKRLRRSKGLAAFDRLETSNLTEVQVPRIEHYVRLKLNLAPSVSVVIPNYNHCAYLKSRLDSVQSQTIMDIEVIVLDDASTDDSIAVICEAAKKDRRLSVIRNDRNSGNPFEQWRKGVALAKSEIIWIAESDDTCERNFISCLLPRFSDDLVRIAHARTIAIDELGKENPSAIASYLERASPGKFNQDYTADGISEVVDSFAAMCTIVNASGVLFRKKYLRAALDRLTGFRICGDWKIYLDIMRGGKICYTTSTVNYFRRHSNSVINNHEGSVEYFGERARIAKFVLENYPVSHLSYRRMLRELEQEWERFKFKHKGKSFADVCDVKLLNAIRKSHPVVERLKIGFYVHGMLFSRGGIERLAASLANELSRRGHQVTIFCAVWSATLRPVYSLAENVKLVPIFDIENEESIKVLNTELRRLEIDVFIPMLSEKIFESMLQAVRDTGAALIMSEHNDPWKIEELWWTRAGRIQTFEGADRIHLLVERFKESLPQALQARITVIPNGVEQPDVGSRMGSGNQIIAVGRLVPQKRFDRLILAFSRLREEFPDWKIRIFGDGLEQRKLEQLIKRHKLSDHVFLMGTTNNIELEYQRGTFFVLPSEFEGFGMVVVEALANGLPCIAFSDCNGPNEIITDDCGLLIDSSDAVGNLAEGMRLLMKNAALRQKMSESALKRARDFSWEDIFNSWEKLVINAAHEPLIRG